jgi:glutamyl-tRNA reductase
MGGAAIDLLVLGVSHKTASVGVRERLAVVPEAMESVLAELAALPSVREALLLSTCNRVEIYVATDRDGDQAAQGLAEALARRAGVTSLELGAHLYERRDAEAVEHLFRVACSLDSLVLGEPQILGQTKQAHESAVRHGTAGPTLNACFQSAFRVARRVRRETAIARNPVSVSSVAIELVRQVFGGFDQRQVLVVGAGKMSELAARTLRTHGASLTVTNRTRARADEMAGRFGAAVSDWSELAAALGVADIVIASTGAQRPVLTVEMLRRVQRARRGRPLFLLDIAVPRDVEPEAGKLDGIYLADIDDLQKVAAEHRDERKNEAADAEAIVAQEHDRFLKAWRGRQLAPTVTALRAHVLGLAQAEAARTISAMPGLGERERRAIADLAESLAKKLLHAPQMALRNDDAADGVSLVVAVQRLFALEIATAAPVEAVEADADRPEASATAAINLPDKTAAGR